MAWAPQKATHWTFTFSTWILCDCDSTTEYWFNQDVYGTDVTCFCTLIFRKWRDIIELKPHIVSLRGTYQWDVYWHTLMSSIKGRTEGKRSWHEAVCSEAVGSAQALGCLLPAPRNRMWQIHHTVLLVQIQAILAMRATTIDLRSWKSTSAQVCYNLFGNVCSELLPSVPLRNCDVGLEACIICVAKPPQPYWVYSQYINIAHLSETWFSQKGCKM